METNELQSLLAVLRESRASVSAPEGFALRVMERLQAEPQPSRRPALIGKLAVAASFIFLLGMNSLLLSRYLNGNGQATTPAVTEFPAGQTVTSPPPDLLSARAEGPKAPASATDGLSVATRPAEQPVPAAPPKKAAAARVLPPRPATPGAQAAPATTPEPAAAKQRFMTASLPPAIIPGPEVFMPKRRVTEGSLLKIAVTDLPQAAQLLAEAAGRRGLVPAVASVSLTDNGRLIKVYRFEVPWLQADMFLSEALRLGQVLDERHVVEDISAEYGQKLEQYRQLAARAKVTEGAEAAALYGEINALLTDLARMHSVASDARAVTVWLEG
jgi:hypothetical protein